MVSLTKSTAASDLVFVTIVVPNPQYDSSKTAQVISVSAISGR